MRRTWSVLVVSLLAVICTQGRARAQDTLVPAGTLLRCTMNEPNFSSATAAVGDPVLCYLSTVQEFGRNAFPRGSYLGGHLESDKEPGHFVGKGNLKIVFDRIGLPSTDVNLDTKVVAARGYKVDKEGEIVGKGHAKRDVVEWMIPPLWPWKVLSLPARGPRPTLKGEETLQLRLMEDVVVPRLSAYSGAIDRPARPTVYIPRPAASTEDKPPYASPVYANTKYRKPVAVPSTDQPGMLNASYTVTEAPKQDLQVIPPEVQQPAPTATEAASSVSEAPRSPSEVKNLTLLALKSETIVAAAHYWVDGNFLAYTLSNGSNGEFELNELDWARTTELNSERGVAVTLKTGSAAQ